MLRPTDRIIFSSEPSLVNLRMAKMRKPGTKVRKINPENCLRMGMLSKTAMSVMISNSNVNRNNLLERAFFSDIIIPCIQ